MKFARGYTFIELLVAVALFTLLLIAIVDMYIRFGSTSARQMSSIDVAQSAGMILNEMNRVGLPADAIVASHTISGTTYTTGSTTVVFELPSITSTGDIISNTHDYAIIYAAGTAVYRKYDTNASSARKASTKQLSDVLGNMTFTYNNVDVTKATEVSTDVRTQATVHGQLLQTHLTSNTYLRNI